MGLLNTSYLFYFKASEKKKNFFRDLWIRTWVFIIRRIVPVFYRLSISGLKENKTINQNEKQIIISLTTYPGRINIVWLSIETLLRQKVRVDKIILWLGEEYFDGISQLPKTLRSQLKRGLSIELRSDLKPHTKYFYVMQEFPDSIIITVDDDKFYPDDLVGNLIDYHNKYPESIICHGARLIKTNGDYFSSYNEWCNWHASMIESNPRYDLLPLGVMGVLYPPGSLHMEVFNISKLKKLCFHADDLWLKVMALKNKTQTVLTNSYSHSFIEIPYSQNDSLMSSNLSEGKNDIQFQSLTKEYDLFIHYNDLVQPEKQSRE